MPPIPHSERGQSLSLFVAVVIMAIFLVAGLVVDGGSQSTAARRAQLAAAAAARAGVDATSTARLAGQPASGGVAVAAARASLAGEPGLTSEVDVLAGGRIRVRTRTSVETIFLSAIGIGRLSASGEAEAQLFSG